MFRKSLGYYDRQYGCKNFSGRLLLSCGFIWPEHTTNEHEHGEKERMLGLHTVLARWWKKQHPEDSHVSYMTANFNHRLTVPEQCIPPPGLRNESTGSLPFYYQQCGCPVSDAITDWKTCTRNSKVNYCQSVNYYVKARLNFATCQVTHHNSPRPPEDEICAFQYQYNHLGMWTPPGPKAIKRPLSILCMINRTVFPSTSRYMRYYIRRSWPRIWNSWSA
jgi:hypothetical protein